ncbi:MAG: 7-cyano-7-deazaguanine synthase QueC [bacterium]
MKTIEKAVVLLSGGLDSTTLLHYITRKLGVREVYALSFLYGQKHQRELDEAAWQAKAAGVKAHDLVDMGFFGALTPGSSALTDAAVAVPKLADLDEATLSQPPTYVPNRNMMLLSVAAAYAESRGIRDIFYGAQTQDAYGYWDCTPEFVNRINALLALNHRPPVQVHAPFSRLRKADELKLGLELGVDYAHTWTCYRGGDKPCGECPSCVERATAFREIGLADPLC